MYGVLASGWVPDAAAVAKALGLTAAVQAFEASYLDEAESWVAARWDEAGKVLLVALCPTVVARLKAPPPSPATDTTAELARLRADMERLQRGLYKLVEKR